MLYVICEQPLSHKIRFSVHRSLLADETYLEHEKTTLIKEEQISNTYFTFLYNFTGCH